MYLYQLLRLDGSTSVSSGDADKDQIHVMKVTMMKEKTAKDDTMKN